jgi:hypothetical protein
MSPEPSLDLAGHAEVDVAWGDLSAQTHGVQLCWLFVSPLVSVDPLASLCAPDLLPSTASALLTPGGGDAAAPADSSKRTREGTAGRFMNPARPHIDTSDQNSRTREPDVTAEPTRKSTSRRSLKAAGWQERRSGNGAEQPRGPTNGPGADRGECTHLKGYMPGLRHPRNVPKSSDHHGWERHTSANGGSPRNG